MAAPSAGRVVLCTGANQGLGLAILQQAVARDPSATYILTSRNLDAGREAAKTLTTEKEGAQVDVDVLQLDVTNDGHIAAAAKSVEEKYGKLDGT